jgi:hypothetical protein
LKTLLSFLAFATLALTVEAQSITFYGTNAQFAIRFVVVGNICQPRDIGMGIQYVQNGLGEWKGYLATVRNDRRNHYIYNSGNYGGPTNGFTIVRCTNRPPSLSVVSDKLKRFTLTVSNP